MIVGLSGKKGSGKTTVAKYLAGRLEDAVVISFADPLKDIVSQLFDVPLATLTGTEEAKNTVTPSGKTARVLMQDAGMAMRSVWPHCWVTAWGNRVERLYAEQGTVVPVVVPDVRFKNEVAKIRMLGGVVIRLTRNPLGFDGHQSETELDDWNGFDAVIDNALLTEDEANLAAFELCQELGVV